METASDPTADVRRRGLDILAELRILRAEVASSVEELARALQPRLPEGVEMADTFIPVAQHACTRADGSHVLIDSELRARDRPFSVEIAVTMLQNEAHGQFDLVDAVLGSLAPFVDDDEADPRLAEISRLLTEMRLRIQASRSALRELERAARLAAGRGQWADTCAEVPEEQLLSLWRRLLRSDAHLEDLAREANLGAEKTEAFRSHVLATAVRLEGEFADTVRQGDPSPGSDDEGDGEVPAHDTVPLCVKLDVPDPVAQGEVFTLSLRIRNDNIDSSALDSIDLEPSFISGFRLRGVEPAPHSMEVDPDDGGVVLNYEDHVVAPGETLDVNIRLRGDACGNFTGEVTVWTGAVDVSTVIPNVDVVTRN